SLLQAALRGNQLAVSGQLARGLSTPGNTAEAPGFWDSVAALLGLNSAGDLTNPTITFNGPMGYPVVAQDAPPGQVLSKTAGVGPFGIFGGGEPALPYNTAVDVADMLNTQAADKAGRVPSFTPAGGGFAGGFGSNDTSASSVGQAYGL